MGPKSGYAKCYIRDPLDVTELMELIAHEPWVRSQGLRPKIDGRVHYSSHAVSLTISGPSERKHTDGSSVTGAERSFDWGVTDLQANGRRKVATYHIYVHSQTRWVNIRHHNWQQECDFILSQITDKVQK